MKSLVVKYAVMGAVLAPAGIFLAGLLGMHLAIGYISAAVAGAIGGAAGGWLRQRAGKRS